MPEHSDIDKPDNAYSSPGSLPQRQASSPSEGAGPSSELPIPPEILDKLPPEARARVLGVFAAGMQWAGPLPNPLLAKIEPRHITDMIGLASKTVDLTHSDRRHSRLLGTITLALILGVSLALLLVLALRNQNDLLLDVIKIGGLGVGAFGGGYGFASWRNRE